MTLLGIAAEEGGRLDDLLSVLDATLERAGEAKAAALEQVRAGRAEAAARATARNSGEDLEVGRAVTAPAASSPPTPLAPLPLVRSARSSLPLHRHYSKLKQAQKRKNSERSLGRWRCAFDGGTSQTSPRLPHPRHCARGS